MMNVIVMMDNSNKSDGNDDSNDVLTKLLST